MKNDIDFKEVDRILEGVSKKIRELKNIDPVNTKEERDKFFESDIYNPIFSYQKLDYDPNEINKILNNIEISYGDSDLVKIYKGVIDKFLTTNSIVKNRGKKDFVREASIKLYDTPGKELVDYADKLLTDMIKVKDTSEKNISSEELKKSLEKYLAEKGLKYDFEFSDKKLTTSRSAEKKITISRLRQFSQDEVNRLKVHELEVHVFRIINGEKQFSKLFALGFPGYLVTEEGMATYIEELSGYLDKVKMKDYAARVIAVDSVCKKDYFRKTFDRLKRYGLDDKQSWHLSVRAHRGGGFVKDHVYLKGYLEIKKFVEDGGDLKMLFCGKIGIEDIPYVERLNEKGILKKAEYLPECLN